MRYYDMKGRLIEIRYDGGTPDEINYAVYRDGRPITTITRYPSGWQFASGDSLIRAANPRDILDAL
jgi:hypothetical protein